VWAIEDIKPILEILFLFQKTYLITINQDFKVEVLVIFPAGLERYFKEVSDILHEHEKKSHGTKKLKLPNVTVRNF
jgi:hypothetical protein